MVTELDWFHVTQKVLGTNQSGLSSSPLTLLKKLLGLISQVFLRFWSRIWWWGCVLDHAYLRFLSVVVVSVFGVVNLCLAFHIYHGGVEAGADSQSVPRSLS